MVHPTKVLTFGLSTNDKKECFLRLIVFTIGKITSTIKEIGGADIAKAIRDLVLPTFPLQTYPVTEGNTAVIDPDICGSRRPKQWRSVRTSSRIIRNKHMPWSLDNVLPSW
jgi:hypothetical protein